MKVNTKINIVKIFLIIGAIMTTSGISLTLYNNFSTKLNTSTGEKDIKETTSFFLKNKENKYALFDITGKKMTDFIYTSVTSFINEKAVVKQDDKVGIIDTHGKMTVKFGKYKNISSASGLYKAEKENNHYELINGQGKVLYNMDSVDLKTYLDGDTYSILEDKKKKTYTVLNYEGKKLETFAKDENEKEPTTNAIDNYISVFYKGKNRIFNINTGKKVADFAAQEHYCVNQVVKDGKVIILNSCTKWYEKKDHQYYKIIDQGKIFDIEKECSTIITNEDQILCKTKETLEYLFNENYKRSLEVTGYKAYKNENEYATRKKGVFGEVDIYQNNKIVKNIACRSLAKTGYAKEGFYIVGTYDSRDCNTESGIYEFYKTNGEKAFDQSFRYADQFDTNSNAVVSENKKDYYLINNKGKKVGNFYDNIKSHYNYYIVTKENKKGMINKDGKEIVPCKYLNITLNKNQNKIYATLTLQDKNKEVYNLDDNRSLLTTSKSLEWRSYYIYVSDNTKKEYYTLEKGKLFFEERL